MLHPTLDELNKANGTDLNRYQMAMASAKCARQVIDEYSKQRAEADRRIEADKTLDRDVSGYIDAELREEKAMHVAVKHMEKGEYEICLEGAPEEDKDAQ